MQIGQEMVSEYVDKLHFCKKICRINYICNKLWGTGYQYPGADIQYQRNVSSGIGTRAIFFTDFKLY